MRNFGVTVLRIFMVIYLMMFVLLVTLALIVLILRKPTKDLALKIDQINSKYRTLLQRQTFISKSEYLEWDGEAQELRESLPILCIWPFVPYGLTTKIFALKKYLDRGYGAVAAANLDYVRFKMAEDLKWFDHVEKYPLSKKQRGAIVFNENNVLVLAGAGTGKTSTILGKVGFVLKEKLAQPDEILLLAFNKNAAEEMRERIEARFKAQLNIRTFHSLGLEIVSQVYGKPKVSKLADDPEFRKIVFQRWLDDILQESATGRLLKHFFAFYFYPYRALRSFTSIAEYYLHLRSNAIRTLMGEAVKSQEECVIANWLCLNGIEYEYERPYKHSTRTPEKRQYCPDFYLPEYDIHIEHFGVDREGNAPSFMKPVEYKKSMDWKRGLHQEHQTRLIETYSWQHEEGVLFSTLEKRLLELGVILKPISLSEVHRLTEKGGYLSRLADLFNSFLRHYRSNQVSLESLRKETDGKPDSPRYACFLNVFERFYQKYEHALKSSNEIDFEGMIFEATDLLEQGKYKAPWKYVLVDEFQDISRPRARLLKALLGYHPHRRLFCVGDDWQAIYRFAGSDITIMREFGNQFGFSYQTALDITFRFNDALTDLSSKFILKNKKQLTKALRSLRQTGQPSATLIPASGDNLSATLKQISQFDASKQKTVLILGRYQHSLPDRETQNSLKKSFPNLAIEAKTAHSSKGLESDYVIVSDLCSGIYGFPSEIVDDPILDLVLPAKEGFPNAEERRLFYVALTRAREKVYLTYPADNPSKFILELDSEEYRGLIDGGLQTKAEIRCPHCAWKQFRKLSPSLWQCANRPFCEKTFPGCDNCRDGALVPVHGRLKTEMACSSTSCNHIAKLCARCEQGAMVMRKGPRGEFLGCSEYPNCKYTAKTASV